MQEGIYDMLLDLADFCTAETVSQNAMAVLDLLPTAPSIVADLEQAFKEAQPQKAVKRVLEGPDLPNRHARLLYTLQVHHKHQFCLCVP